MITVAKSRPSAVLDSFQDFEQKICQDRHATLLLLMMNGKQIPIVLRYFYALNLFHAYLERSRPARKFFLAACVKILENFCKTPKTFPVNQSGLIDPWLATTVLVSRQDLNLFED